MFMNSNVQILKNDTIICVLVKYGLNYFKEFDVDQSLKRNARNHHVNALLIK